MPWRRASPTGWEPSRDAVAGSPQCSARASREPVSLSPETTCDWVPDVSLMPAGGGVSKYEQEKGSHPDATVGCGTASGLPSPVGLVLRAKCLGEGVGVGRFLFQGFLRAWG